jgi:hypothetical protein
VLEALRNTRAREIDRVQLKVSRCTQAAIDLDSLSRPPLKYQMKLPPCEHGGSCVG